MKNIENIHNTIDKELHAPPLNPLLTLGDHDPESIPILVAYVRKRTGLPVYAEDKIRDLIKSRHGDFRTKFLQGYLICFIYLLLIVLGKLQAPELMIWLPQSELMEHFELLERVSGSPSSGGSSAKPRSYLQRVNSSGE